MSETTKVGPGNESEAHESQAEGLDQIVQPVVSVVDNLTTDESRAAVFFRNSYAVLVRGKAVRRHLFFNLPAAERTVNRARARGDEAEMILVRLVPVDARYPEDRGDK